MDRQPYDPSTLSERIQSQLTGIEQLSAYFAMISKRGEEAIQHLPNEKEREVEEMIRIHLGDEWWADMERECAQGFLKRKQAALSHTAGRSANAACQVSPPPPPLGRELSLSDVPPIAMTQPQAGLSSSLTPNEPSPTEQDPFLFQSDSIPSTLSSAPPVSSSLALPDVLAEIGQKIGAPLGLKDLVVEDDSPEGNTKKTKIMDDGTVLNEEGLPFLDIRESPTAFEANPTSRPSTPSASPSEFSIAQAMVSNSAGAQSDHSVDQASAALVDEEYPDDYWSAESKKRRAELKRRLFGTSSVRIEAEFIGEEADEVGAESRSDYGKPGMASKAVVQPSPDVHGRSPGRAPPNGYMVKTTVIKASPPTPHIEELSSEEKLKTPVTDKPQPKTAEQASSSSSSEDGDQNVKQDDKRPSRVTRRKSVTFASEAHVRTFEKGEAMPMSAQGVDFPDREDIALREALVEAGVPETVLKPIAPAAAMTPKGSQPAKGDGGLFSGFKKGFLTGGDGKAKPISKPQPSAAYKAKLEASKAAIPGIQPVPALMVSGPEDDGASSDRRIPLAEAHIPAPAKRSLFAQRKAEAAAAAAAAKAEAARGESASTEVVEEASSATKSAAPMKQQVMERFSTSPRPLKKAPEALPQPVKSRFGPPPQVPDLDEALMQIRQANTESASTPSTDEPTGGPEDDSDESASLIDGEYSDDGEDYSPAGMEEKLLLRETVMAYHKQRASMGRQGLGGAVGQPDREPGIEEDDVPRYRAVGFGEKVTPRGMEGGLSGAVESGDRSYQEDEDEGEEEDIDVPGGVLNLDNITLPTVIPGSTNLASGIRVGKLENGNLIVQAKDDSSDESDIDNEENQAADRETMTSSEKAQLEKRKAEKKAEEAMRRKLMDPDLAGLMRREAEEANEKRLARDDPELAKEGLNSSRMIGEMPPAIRATPYIPEEVARDAQAVEHTSKMEPDISAEQPKKISKFKAARLAAAAASAESAEPLRLRGGGFDTAPTPGEVGNPQSTPASVAPATTFTIHHALMLRALDLTLNCEISQTAFSVGSTIWLPFESIWCRLLTVARGTHFGELITKGGEMGLILGESWSRALEGNTHAEQNALTIFEQRFDRLGEEIIDGILGRDEDAPTDPEARVVGARRKVLGEARIYATMEPCSVRTSGLPSCSAAILSSGLKEVYIGVQEPSDYVNCEGLRILRDGGVTVRHIQGMEAECLRAARRGLTNGPLE